jgi:hypothetical protein
MKINNDRGYTKIFSVFVLIAFLIPACRLYSQSRVFISNGIFDGRKNTLSEAPIALNGNWTFFDGQLLTPGQVLPGSSSTLPVPSLWNEHAHLKNIGCGTYVLKLILPRQEKWALQIPQLYNSYSLYINDALLAGNGKPAIRKEDSSQEWRPQYVVFDTPTDTTTIVLQLANYHHFKGGIREPILLGRPDAVKSHFRNAMYSVLLEALVVGGIGAFFLFLFFRGRKGRITLYFGLLCLSWATREMFSDVYPIATLVPAINWFFLVKTEYVTLFLITIFSTILVNRLFPELSSNVFKYLVVFINCVYTAFVIFAPVIIFTRWLPLYLMTSAVVLVYAGVMIMRAMVLEKAGTWFLITGLILSIVAFGYDLIAYEGVFSNQVMVGSLCYILIYLSCSIGILQQLKIIQSPATPANTLRYQDLYKN